MTILPLTYASTQLFCHHKFQPAWCYSFTHFGRSRLTSLIALSYTVPTTPLFVNPFARADCLGISGITVGFSATPLHN